MKNEKGLKISLQRDLKYEIEMLNKSYNNITKEFPFIFEAFLVHARVLCDFFYHKTSKFSDEVIAVNYIPKWRRKKSKKISEVQGRINKYVTHLSIERVTRKI